MMINCYSVVLSLVVRFRGRMVVAVTDLNTEKKKHVKQQSLHTRLQRDLADVQNQLQGASSRVSWRTVVCLSIS